MGDDERRINSRVEKINLVQVSRFDEAGFRADLAAGRTLNLSTGGCRLELHYALPLRSKLRLDLAIDDQLVQVEGTVVYLEALDDQRCAMGVAFSRLPPDAQALIDKAIH